MNFKIMLSLIVGLMIAGPSFAQSSLDVKYWSLLSLKFDRGFQDLTDKYDGYQSSSILFNRDFVKINIFKSQPCSTGSLCARAPQQPDLTIKLQVRKIISYGCYDSYYASTGANIKSALYEQVIVNRFASERCQTIAEVSDGYIHFKASGLSKSTGEQVSAQAYATLVDVKIVNEVTLPPSPLPAE
jgi:hypothetical protein